jgi:Glycosyl transferase family 2
MAAGNASRRCAKWIAIDGELPLANRHAGGARRAALLMALSLATADTRLIATTDADSIVSNTWIARQLEWMDRGCDVVLGSVDVSADDLRSLPLELRRRECAERAYAQRLNRIDAWLDPAQYDPWPRHGTPSGASLGFRPDALSAACPLPAPACGEDRALIHRCHSLDMKVRGDPLLRVTTSGRLHGRARGGMADTLMHRIRNPGAPCDEMLESVDRAVTRAQLRAQLRQRHRQGDLSARHLSRTLDLSPTLAHDLLQLPTFGSFWQACERVSPWLARAPLHPASLSNEMRIATEWLLSRALQTPVLAQACQDPAALDISA